MLVACPHCKEKADVSDIAPNTKIACPKCGGEFLTPGALPVASAVESQSPAGPPNFSGPAVASLTLGIIGVLTYFIFVGAVFGVAALILGIAALRRIKARRAQLKGRGMAIAGVILGGLSIVLTILLIIALIDILGPHHRAALASYDHSAQSAGRNAKLAEEIWFNEYEGDTDRQYTDKLFHLLSYDKNLTDDTSVTFIFGACNASGYTFTTIHAVGSKTNVFTND